ncbi:MAG: hypothetical protein H6559_12475 [Lewinellaceae bacterium]|nr:hypothetical protein [Lewinellaceae bacterium]
MAAAAPPHPGWVLRFPRPRNRRRAHFQPTSGIEETSNKAFLTQFPEICPPMQLCQTVDDIWNFQERFPIVLKPLENYGGAGWSKLPTGLFTKTAGRSLLKTIFPSSKSNSGRADTWA